MWKQKVLSNSISNQLYNLTLDYYLKQVHLLRCRMIIVEQEQTKPLWYNIPTCINWVLLKCISMNLRLLKTCNTYPAYDS
jgi:hypothetical protein